MNVENHREVNKINHCMNRERDTSENIFIMNVGEYTGGKKSRSSNQEA